MNLYRRFMELRKTEDYMLRQNLIGKMRGKSRFTEEDVNEILAYKRLPYHSNTQAGKYTSMAFESSTLGDKLRLLKRLNGVGSVTASTILMAQNPFRYAEINHKAWDQLRRNHGFTGGDKDHRSDFSVGEYREYLEVLASLAKEHGMAVADAEYVLTNHG